MRILFIVLTCLLTFSVTLANANSYDLGIAQSFNTFVFNDFSASSSDVQGRLAVGGNAQLSGYSVGDQLTPGQSDPVLVVGGNLTYNSGRVYHGRAVVGGTATLGHQNIADGGVFTNQPMPFSFADEQTRLINESSSISNFSPTGSVTSQWGGITLTGDGSSSLQIFNVNGSDLLNSWGLSAANISSDANVLINVSGQIAGLVNMTMESFAGISERVLFNFYEATDLNLQGVAVQGSILAPLAHITGASGVIWGTTIANSMTGSIQMNHVPHVTPIPAAIWLLGSGMAGLAAIRRRRSK